MCHSWEITVCRFSGKSVSFNLFISWMWIILIKLKNSLLVVVGNVLATPTRAQTPPRVNSAPIGSHVTPTKVSSINCAEFEDIFCWKTYFTWILNNAILQSISAAMSDCHSNDFLACVRSVPSGFGLIILLLSYALTHCTLMWLRPFYCSCQSKFQIQSLYILRCIADRVITFFFIRKPSGVLAHW